MNSTKSRSSAAPAAPKDQKQSWSSSVLGFLKAHVELVLFILGWTALGLLLILYFHGRTYRVGYRRSLRPFLPLHQVEVSFLIAAIDAVIKAFFTTWCTIVAWRTIYILLFTRGTTLNEISSIAFPLPPSLNPFRSSPYRPISLALVIIISLSLPAQYLSTPLLSGSIAWTPTQFEGRKGSVQIPRAGESRAWDEYNRWSEVREILMLRSASIALTTNADSLDRNNAAPRRNMGYYTTFPVNSTVKNVNFPYFIVDDIEWVQDPENEVPKKLISAIQDDNLGLLNISSPAGVITRSTIGNMAVLRDYAWSEAPKISSSSSTSSKIEYAFPRQENQKVMHELYVAVLVDRLKNVHQVESWNQSCTSSSSMFGDMNVANFIDIRYNLGGMPFAINCYAIAKISVRAGSYTFNNSRVISSGIFEAVVSDKEADELRATPSNSRDSLTSQIFEAMPEVMLNLAIIRPVDSALDLTVYTRAMLNISYEATWNVMTDTFRIPESNEVTILYPESGIIMRVLWKPFLGWIALVASASLSGIAFTILVFRVESIYGVRVDLRNTVIAPLRLDMSDAYGSMPALCNFTKPSRSEKKARLHFAIGDSFTSQEQKHEQHTDWCRMRVVQDIQDGELSDTELEELVPHSRT
ncbi:hypothetical protein BGZ61DRAFT_481110 [Ilyonectria robusta]|uniref:uncharacterized protein n=1 Tax=Ilyonectria robusta TaxID=1079257 RepID=UPI001E8E8241|nr:uncharacterized protein BGZ61DRAFT_481110 [Ilyonectria robusta]KAH8680421.1 hypothetical protein BGZ61DRAFT_481110 [Ilyonectria robusta]